MKLSTSIIASLAASTTLAAPIASDISSSTATASASTPSSSAAIDSNDPVQKSALSTLLKILGGGGAAGGLVDGLAAAGTAPGQEVKRELQSDVSIADGPANAIHDKAATIALI
ncbi:unnamed protein product [Ambrosiozyma monospora]|uniref:Unnamed protein product n=1 Tax=Ambrosiozyma monospora TaxID=43982 RepID=A0ACB5T359_AMBMO|nr:unnamed protein product [Ambrosiozyma monospora]